ncbi:MAG: type II toxin-antitoxin system VapC family toxin [Bifidobacteriaceae bacterium]|jgi:predicted nucleic acid-binding protein|nr:type II toxin-antitoxin system VapC family toxin [Bifidobacteriaceae bacterium]
MTYYFDTSALIKHVIEEPETPAFQVLWEDTRHAAVSSMLLKTELIRTASKKDAQATADARTLLKELDLINVTDSILSSAADLPPTVLRTLDAIHLATALTLEDDLDAVVTYDHRMADAARSLGLTVLSPGEAGADAAA